MSHRSSASAFGLSFGRRVSARARSRSSNTCRAERMALDRRVPQGMVGRVVRERDGRFDVLISGGATHLTRGAPAPLRKRPRGAGGRA